MATITFSRTITAAHLTRLIAAMKPYYSLPPSATQQDVLIEFENDVARRLRAIVKDFEAAIAAKAATDAITEISLT